MPAKKKDSLLNSDRERYIFGGPVSRLITKLLKKHKDDPADFKASDYFDVGIDDPVELKKFDKWYKANEENIEGYYYESGYYKDDLGGDESDYIKMLWEQKFDPAGALGKGRTKKAEGGELVAIDETYSAIKSLLSKKQDKAIQNIIANKRIKDYSVLGRGMNMADKATSLAVRGNTDIVIEAPNEKKMYISLGQQMLDAEKRTKKAEGGEMEDQMNALAISVAPAKIKEIPEEEQEMLPDEEMEEDYVDYIVESALEEEDQNYLESALMKDAKLSEIFDQVVESASEFSGSGPIEGPGTEVSDSIPARLSDGEFVFTAKATEEIGADNLQRMMEDAEASVDQRQGAAYGGLQTEKEDEIAPIQTTGLRTARRNVPVVAPTRRQVEEEMLKSSPRRFYQPLSG